VENVVSFSAHANFSKGSTIRDWSLSGHDIPIRWDPTNTIFAVYGQDVCSHIDQMTWSDSYSTYTKRLNPGWTCNQESELEIWVYKKHVEQLLEREIGEVVAYPGQFSTVTNGNEVKFTRVFGRENLEIESEIFEVKEDTIRFLLPCGLIFSQKVFLDSIKNKVARDTVIFEITTNKGEANQITHTDSLIWILPKLLIYDQVVNPPTALQQQILPQYDLVDDYPIDVSSFFFLGKSVDELVGLRVVNTTLRETYSPPPYAGP
jgi:hypothetical protein